MHTVFNMSWSRLLKSALTHKWRLKQGTVTNISLSMKGDATELGISHFSGSFLRPGVILKESWIRQQNFVSRASRSNVIRVTKEWKWRNKARIFNYKIVPSIRRTEQAKGKPGGETGPALWGAGGQSKEHRMAAMNNKAWAGGLCRCPHWVFEDTSGHPWPARMGEEAIRLDGYIR